MGAGSPPAEKVPKKYLTGSLISAYFLQNGLTQFNGVLVGTVIISLWPVLVGKQNQIKSELFEMSLYGSGLFVLSSSPAGGQLSPTVWTLVVIGSATTVIVDRKVERSSFVDCVLKVFAAGRLRDSWPV